MTDFIYTREQIIEACKDTGRSTSSIETKIRDAQRALQGDWIIKNGQWFYTEDFKNVILKWNGKAQIRAYSRRVRKPTQEALPIDSVEPVQMPQSTDSMLIQISESNRKYLKSIEMAGGSPDAFINRLIDSYRI
jgi:hypothetical protein